MTEHPGCVAASAVVYVKDLARMRAFYCQCFELAVADASDDYCVLRSAAWNLSLVAMPAEVAATVEILVPPVRRADTPIKLAFTVASIRDLESRLVRLGGLLDPGATQWEFRGMTHCDCVDPEGNVVQLLEPRA